MIIVCDKVGHHPPDLLVNTRPSCLRACAFSGTLEELDQHLGQVCSTCFLSLLRYSISTLNMIMTAQRRS
jgi:hypothetical protein